MFWLSKSLDACVNKVEILPKNFYEHNPATLIYKKKARTSKWRLNEILSKGELIVKESFEKNLSKDADIKIIWNASKAFIWRQFIQQNNKFEFKKRPKNAKVSKWYKGKEGWTNEITREKRDVISN